MDKHHSSRGHFNRFLFSDGSVMDNFGTNIQHVVVFLFLKALNYFIVALK